MTARLRTAAMVLGSQWSDLGLHRSCREAGAPLVLVTEYSLRTELDIIDAARLPRLPRLRKKLWMVGAEAKRRYMMRRATSLQCSGSPTFETHGRLTRDPLLFFDNRVLERDVIDPARLSARLATLLHPTSPPLRLIYGGRFVPMKGVLFLPQVAAALARRGIPFRLDIVGAGPLEGDLKASIERLGLETPVTLVSPLDFRSGWIPRLEREADVFVCCHPQGDPSSTYPEVMSCGVPIAGFGNEALRGIIERSKSGWQVPVGDVEGLAANLGRLHLEREEIAHAAHRARAFALEHAFERTFRRRAAHLIRHSRLPETLRRVEGATGGPALWDHVTDP